MEIIVRRTVSIGAAQLSGVRLFEVPPGCSLGPHVGLLIDEGHDPEFGYSVFINSAGSCVVRLSPLTIESTGELADLFYGPWRWLEGNFDDYELPCEALPGLRPISDAIQQLGEWN